MKKTMVMVSAILLAMTLPLATTEKAEAFDVGFFFVPGTIIGGLMLYRQHPECREADSIGALAECVQKAATGEQEKQKKGEDTTEEK